ncbi:MAG: hypothetical protein ACYCTZ_14075 [Candidatus Dormibacteria bacterium]
MPGLELLEVPEGDLCCGSAGTYNLTEVRAALAESGDPLPAFHPVELIAGCQQLPTLLANHGHWGRSHGPCSATAPRTCVPGGLRQRERRGHD